MDWVAITAVATIALVAVGYLQFRALRSHQTSDRRSSASSAIPTPTISYKIQTGSGSYSLPENWKPDVMSDEYDIKSQLKIDLSDFSFGIIVINNENNSVVHRIYLDLNCNNLWSAKIEETKHLSKSAIRLSIAHQGLRIEIDELPAGDRIIISMVGGFVGGGISPANAAINLKRLWD